MGRGAIDLSRRPLTEQSALKITFRRSGMHLDPPRAWLHDQSSMGTGLIHIPALVGDITLPQGHHHTAVRTDAGGKPFRDP